jgi:hypothetical protein
MNRSKKDREAKKNTFKSVISNMPSKQMEAVQTVIGLPFLFLKIMEIVTDGKETPAENQIRLATALFIHLMTGNSWQDIFKT